MKYRYIPIGDFFKVLSPKNWNLLWYADKKWWSAKWETLAKAKQSKDWLSDGQKKKLKDQKNEIERRKKESEQKKSEDLNNKVNWVKDRHNKENTEKIDNQDIEDFWNEWTNVQQWLSDNPQEYESLLDEITIFDDHYDRLVDNLNNERKLSLDEINQDYKQTLDKINLDNSLNEEEKVEAIKSAIDWYMFVHEELNFNKELAYKNASKSIKSAIQETWNISAQNYINQISNWIIWWNIWEIDANQILRSLKEYREDVADNLETQQMDIEFQRRKALKQLETEVWSNQAQDIYNQAQWINPSLNSSNIGNQLPWVNRYWELNVNSPNQTFWNYQWSINQWYKRKQWFNQLSKENAKNNQSQKTNRLNFWYDKSLYWINQDKKEKELGYMQNQMQYTPYLKSWSKYIFGNKAKDLWGQSIAQRNKWKNQLWLWTFRVY